MGDGDSRRGRGSFGGEFGTTVTSGELCDVAVPKLLWAGLVHCVSDRISDVFLL